jgi:acyl-CoA thioester hydrolase
MALKDDPTWLIRDRYPLHFTTRILYADMDAFRHLNNGATGRYFEEGRADLNMSVFGKESMIDPPGGLQLLFATVTIDFIKQAHYPGTVEIATGLTRIGSSSYIIAQAAFQHDVCFALSEAVMVKAVDGRPAALVQEEKLRMERLLISNVN